MPSYRIGSHTFEAASLDAGLYLVSTPIGAMADITVRALSTLAAADLVLCEDTRITSRLLQHYAIATRLKPYHDHNAARERPVILQFLQEGKAVALVSDAGAPLISDPGYKLVRETVSAGLPVHVVPGASAPVAALALSGLPCDRFTFAGFLPAKATARRRALAELADVPGSLILFETAARLPACLDDIREVLGDREIAIAREMTKLHEEVLRGPASVLSESVSARTGLKGEITMVIAPAALSSSGVSDEIICEALREALSAMPASRAAAAVARQLGLNRKDVYARALDLKGTLGDDRD